MLIESTILFSKTHKLVLVYLQFEGKFTREFAHSNTTNMKVKLSILVSLAVRKSKVLFLEQIT